MRTKKFVSLLAAAPLALSLALTPTVAQAATPTPTATVQTASLLTRLRAALPADVSARLTSALAASGAAESGLAQRALNVIDPGQYDCGSTVLAGWIADQLSDWTEEDMLVVLLTGAFMWPTFDAALFSDASTPETYGRSGQYTKIVTKTWRQLGGFWDAQPTGTDLAPMHSRMVTDVAKVTRMLGVLGLDAETAALLAPELVAYFNTPKFEYGNHPFFSLNAFAIVAEEEVLPGYTAKRRIIMGDGIMEAYRDLGFGDIAPQAVLAHEFGHQVQQEVGVFDTAELTPEGSRHVELMADALGTYFDTHVRGASMQWKRAQQIAAVSHSIGDCRFDNPAHHGTPNQRMRASEWAYALEESALPRSFVLPAAEFVDTFDAALPEIVAPDAVG